MIVEKVQFHSMKLCATKRRETKRKQCDRLNKRYTTDSCSPFVHRGISTSSIRPLVVVGKRSPPSFANTPSPLIFSRKTSSTRFLTNVINVPSSSFQQTSSSTLLNISADHKYESSNSGGIEEEELGEQEGREDPEVV